MRITRSRIAAFVLFTFMAQMLSGCSDFITSDPNLTLTPGLATPEPVNIEPQNPDYAFAQATMEAGESQLSDLSHQATQVSMEMAQAADAAALLTQEYNQRQKTELDYQSTLISQNMAMAAATQAFLAQQTQIAMDAAAAAQSSADCGHPIGLLDEWYPDGTGAGDGERPGAANRAGRSRFDGLPLDGYSFGRDPGCAADAAI